MLKRFFIDHQRIVFPVEGLRSSRSLFCLVFGSAGSINKRTAGILHVAPSLTRGSLELIFTPGIFQAVIADQRAGCLQSSVSYL
jgi:hypothetical protein